MSHAAVRYLESKRSVDDRALSVPVREALRESLPEEPRILEAGCGTGTMVPRLVEWGITAGTYRGIDRDRGVVEFARYARPRDLRRRGHAVTTTPRGFTHDRLAVTFEIGDALTAFGSEDRADLFVASSFADLVPLVDLFETVDAALRPGGLAYLPLSFDGGTIFQPDHEADDAVEAVYHEAIASQPGRDPYAGRHALAGLSERPGTIEALASSDWIVRPSDGGTYPADEAYFLARILDFVAETVGESNASVPGFDDWLRTRREQLAAADLIYVAHQYDVLYRTPDA